MNPTLWDQRARTTLEERYAAWLATPDGQRVSREVLRRALALRRQGFKRYGIAAIWEAIRYDWSVRAGPDAAGFAFNNDWRSRLARDLMAENAELVGFFETRTLTA